MYTKNKKTVAISVRFKKFIYDNMFDDFKIKFNIYLKEVFGERVSWEIKKYGFYKSRIKVLFPTKQPFVEDAEELTKSVFELTQRDLMIKYLRDSYKDLHEEILDKAHSYKENNKRSVIQALNLINKRKNENKSIRENPRLYARNI